MSIFSFEFAVREALTNIRRNGVSALATVSTVAISFAVLGVFLVAFFVVERLAGSWKGRIEVAAFLEDSVSREQVREIEAVIAGLPHVAETVFVPNEQAWPAFRKEMGFGSADDLGGIANPLPDAFKIKVDDPRYIIPVAEAVRRIRGIEHVREWATVARRLVAVSDFVKIGGAIAGFLLFLGMAAVVSNALHLTIHARRRDISIMRLVGATDWFIRLPLVLEGVLLGLLGAAVAAGVVILAYDWGVAALARAAPLVDRFYAGLPALQFGLLLAALGMLVGFGGSLVSMRRYLLPE
jgi:cell division transport system permease protein